MNQPLRFRENQSAPLLHAPQMPVGDAPHQYGLALFIIVGLIVLQIIILIAAVLFSGDSLPDDLSSSFNINTNALEQPAPQSQPAPPTPAPQPAQVAQPIPPDNALGLKLRGMEITQGIQVFNEPENSYCNPNPAHNDYIFCNNSMPMVAGRHTLVRVYPVCGGNCPTSETTFTLRLLKGGQEKLAVTRQLPAEMAQRVTGLSLFDLRANLDNSINFEFFPPPDWLYGEITFELEATPPGNESSVSLSVTKNFAKRKPLRVAYLPIEHKGVSPLENVDAAYWLLRMYPVPDVDYYRLPVPDLTWDTELSKSELLRKLLYSYMLYTQYNPDSRPPDQLFGWLPHEFYNGGVSDPFWCPNCAGPHSSRIGFGGLRPEHDIGGPRILVHEIAHNLGAQHAWSPTHNQDSACFRAEGVDIKVDPDWPYIQTPHIQEFGIDLYSTPPVVYPPNHYDMMAYCAQPWISPHTYRKIFDSPLLQPDAPALVGFQPPLATDSDDTLLVSGMIFPDGTITRPEVRALAGGAAPGFTPPPGTDYCLQVQNVAGKVISQHCFDPGFMNLETGLPTDPNPYFFTMPGLKLADVGQVSLIRNDSVVVSVSPSANPPQVVLSAQSSDTLTWQATDADGDSLLFDLLYSADGGQRWTPLATHLTQTRYTLEGNQLPIGQNLQFRVVASDGFNAASSEINVAN